MLPSLDTPDVKLSITTHSLESGEINNSGSGSGLPIRNSSQDQILPLRFEDSSGLKIGRKALVERGLVQLYKPLNIGVDFTSTPMWLLALDKQVVNTMTFWKFDSLDKLFYYLDTKTNGQLFKNIIHEIGSHKCRFGDRGNVYDLVLINGA